MERKTPQRNLGGQSIRSEQSKVQTDDPSRDNDEPGWGREVLVGRPSGTELGAKMTQQGTTLESPLRTWPLLLGVLAGAGAGYVFWWVLRGIIPAWYGDLL